MADPHGHSSPHADEVQEDVLRTPGWLPLLGLGLLMSGALAVYLWISPGVLNPPSAAEGGADGGAESAPQAPPGNANAPR